MKRFARKQNPAPAGYHPTYHVDRTASRDRHTLAWVDRDGRGYEISLDPYDGTLMFTRGVMTDDAQEHASDFVAVGRLQRGVVVMSDASWRKLGSSGRVVYEQMWPELLTRMARWSRQWRR